MCRTPDQSGSTKGAFDGVGTYHVSNGDSFRTTWRNNRVNGVVDYSFANGDRLVGDFKDDQPVGNVRVTLKETGINRAFPWPDTEAKSVSDHAQAARNFALKLAGRTSFAKSDFH